MKNGLTSTLFESYVRYDGKKKMKSILDAGNKVKFFQLKIEESMNSIKLAEKGDFDAVIKSFGVESAFLEEKLDGSFKDFPANIVGESQDMFRKKTMQILELSAGIYQVNEHKEINIDLFSLFIFQRVRLVVEDSEYEHRLMIYNYTSGTYSRDIEPLKLIIFKYLQLFAFAEELALSSIESKVIEYLRKSVEHIDAAKFDTNYFSFLNCDLKFDDGTILPHSPEHLTTMQSGVSFDLTATAPNFKKFLNDIFADDEDTISFLQEFFGYVLQVSQRANAFLVIVGPGANGKSVLVSILASLIGIKNVSAVPFESLSSPFALQPMLGKKINIATENLPEISNSAKLKSITAGEEISINRKNLPEITSKLGVKLVFVLNDEPLFRDSSHGLVRRLFLIRMDKIFKKSEQDPYLENKLRAELPGIMNWSLVGLRRLIENNFKFTTSESMENAKHNILAKTSPVASFVDEIVVLSNGNVMKCKDVHDYFQEWCASKGIMIGVYSSAAKFWNIFSEEFTAKYKTALIRGKSGTNVVRDIKLK